MALRKTAIAVPDDVLQAIDKAAKRRGESRSRYITTVLRAAARAARDQEITRRLNELFADEGASEEQRRSAATFDELGTDWTDERW